MFDLKTLERVHKMWNKDEMVRWEVSRSMVEASEELEVWLRLGTGPRIMSLARVYSLVWWKNILV